MRRTRRLFIVAALLVIAAPLLLLAGAVLIPTTAPPPGPALRAMRDSAAAIARADLPATSHFTARDGTRLAFRAYPAAGRRVAILVHGAAVSGFVLHPLARQLQAAGVSAYAPDIRGHGDSGPHGDIAYVGQLEDDLEDFLRELAPRHAGAEWSLIGHSLGGGFALRIAGSPTGKAFRQFILLAPFLNPRAPTQREASGGWAHPNLPRLVALTVLNRWGVHALDGLPVIAYATAPQDQARLTPLYSFRLFSNFRPHEDYAVDLSAHPAQTWVLVGDRDEIFRPEAYAPLLSTLAPGVTVRTMEGVGHLGLVTDPRAIAQIVQAVLE